MKIRECLECGVPINAPNIKRCKPCSRIRHKQMTDDWRAKNKDHIQKYGKDRKLQSRIACKKSCRKGSSRFNYAVRNAAKRNKVWELSLELYEKLILNPCAYCFGPVHETCIGLDRMDHRIGYVESNVVPCCKKCNFRKGLLEGAGFVYPRTVELTQELLRGAHDGC
jgi:hypothetical protein